MLVDPIQFIVQERRRGKLDSDIRSTLIQQGYTDKQVRDYFNGLKAPCKVCSWVRKKIGING